MAGGAQRAQRGAQAGAARDEGSDGEGVCCGRLGRLPAAGDGGSGVGALVACRHGMAWHGCASVPGC